MEKIWEAKLDDIYNCQVIRENESQGTLTIERDGNILFTETVGLAYGAIFGPDVSDVAYWEDQCVAFVDGIADGQQQQ
jgi:hypothetical protein